MKFGFELEMFCRTPITDGDAATGQYCLVPPGLPYDECGWLVEVRSEPHWNVRKAIALLEAETKLVYRQAADKKVILEQQPLARIPRDLKVQAARQHTKGLIRYRNIYGHETHRCRTDFATASVHISFTNESVKTFSYDKVTVDGKFLNKSRVTEEFKYNGFIDHAKLIVGLDKAFATEIRAAQRNPGFYEVKDDGRIEYRSLPNNVDLEKVGDVLTTLIKD